MAQKEKCSNFVVIGIVVAAIALVIAILVLVLVLVLRDTDNEFDITECYEEVDGSDYRGVVNTTRTGDECAKWTAQTPHYHSRTPENYPKTGLGDHNYCRNPDGDVGVWCYTTDPDTRWGYCDIGSPSDDCGGTTLEPTTVILGSTSAENPVYTTIATEHVSTPGIVTYKTTEASITTMGTTEESVTTKETTTMFVIDTDECFKEQYASDYRGTVNTTIHGKTCQKWSDQTPHSHTRTPANFPGAGLGNHNYCRNPDGEIQTWCYTTEPGTRWELCDVGYPFDNCVFTSDSPTFVPTIYYE
ncbi:apolipoprotein(a)-like [Saccoglossus kowalevskii]|uniref:Apolipoprotein(A)-like n=1 Tax=Saccoglossus kowalevskii TaxID=10224 RepID=A0ABM0H146_SACKO|nr:PREDICTED: apolipoprotein(a)-like [Saccoglossus kowalevskii]